MLNLVAFDKEYDSELLESSYNAIKHKQHLQIVLDDTEKQVIHQTIIAALTVPVDATFKFQNLFKLTLPNGQFYIAQCLFDFGYPVSSRLSQSSIHKYHFQLVGIAKTKIDLGKSLLRRETKTDKIIGRFFGNDIDFDGTEKFNDKYYLVSDKKEVILHSFDKAFVNTIAKYDDILIITKDNNMFISFETEMEEIHSRAIEEIFSNFKFLAD